MSTQLSRVRGFNNTHLLREEVGYNGKLYFAAAPDYDTEIYEEGQSAAVIWETDGTAEGTKVLHDFAPGATRFVPSHLRVANDHLFFEIRIDEDPSYRYELWSYNTTLDQDDITLTRLVYSLDGQFPDARFDDNIEPINSGLFFLQKDEDGLNELWFTNGNTGPENTYSLGGNEPGKPLSSFVRLVGSDNLLYFIADGRESIPGREDPVYDPNELWSTTSQPGTFNKLSDFDFTQIGSFASPISEEVAIGDSLYFTGRTKFDVGFNYDIEPWVSHGSDQTTQQIANLNPEWYSDNTPFGTRSQHFTSFKGEIYFLGTSNYGFNEDPRETLYAYNPSSGDVREVAQTAEEWRNYSYRELFVFNDNLYFSGHTKESGWELWQSDGTSQGTGFLKDIKANGSSSSHPQGFTVHRKDRTLYSADDDDLYFHTEYGRVWKLAGKSGLVEEIQVEDSRWEGAGKINSVDIINGATDLYFTSGLSLYKLSDQLVEEPSAPNPEPEPGPEPESTPEPNPEPSTEPELPQRDGIIKSVLGKGKLFGTNEADLFSFQVLDVFSRKAADKIIGFNPSQGDKIAINIFVFPGLDLQQPEDLSFVSTNKKKELRLLSKQNFDFVYFEKKGRLFYDGNGTEKNWGNINEGGLVAVLKGRPELTVDDFTVLG